MFKIVLFSIGHVLISKDHFSIKIRSCFGPPGRNKKKKLTEMWLHHCIHTSIAWSEICVCVHLKLYHRGFGHSKSAPLHACPTTQISMVTSVGHPMRGGGGARGRGVCVAHGEFWGHWLEWEWCNVSLCKFTHTWETQISFLILTLFHLRQPHENITPFSYSLLPCFENNTFAWLCCSYFFIFTLTLTFSTQWMMSFAYSYFFSSQASISINNKYTSKTFHV